MEADFTVTVALGATYRFNDRYKLDLQYKGLWVDYQTGSCGQPGYFEYDTVELIAYLVMDSHNEYDSNEFRRFLSKQLPQAMIPKAFVLLEKLPLLSNGKLDRKALPEADLSHKRIIEAPNTETEKELVTIWREVLELERIGVNDDFFDLGGHSLLASTMLFRVRETTGVEVPLRVMFETPTVAELADHIETLKYVNCDAANDARQQDREEIML